ncbi:MAG: putative low-complexity protein [Bacteroidetes bacterium]|nr:putative low-complexity protein [Bacteroidota bacterium]
MEEATHLNKVFEKVNSPAKTIRNREFEACTFKQCDLSNCDFANSRFTDCTFINCNLTMIRLNNVSLINAVFKDCKLMGIIFSECADFLFSVRFENGLLDYSSFMGKKMMGTVFINTTLKDVNFSNANLTKAVFDKTNLSGAIFNGTVLQEANLVTAFAYSIDGELNKISKAHFSLQGVVGLLDKYRITIE